MSLIWTVILREKVIGIDVDSWRGFVRCRSDVDMCIMPVPRIFT